MKSELSKKLKQASQFLPGLETHKVDMGTLSQKKGLISLFLYEMKFDSDNVPYIQKKFLEGRKKQYFPITAIEFGLYFYNQFLKKKNGKGIFKKNMLNIADWLLENGIEGKNDSFVWHHAWPMKIAGYTFKKPYKWVSGIVQGEALSLLIRAHSLSGKQKYLDTAKNVLTSFEFDVDSGGILDIDCNGNWWYEEFACEKRHHVLNGFMYALIGLKEFYDYTKDKQAKLLFEKGLETLEKNLYKFNVNLGFFRWSRYDTGKIFFSGKLYHTIHLIQLKWIYEKTKSKILLKTLKKWETQNTKHKLALSIFNIPILVFQKVKGLM